MYLLLVYIAIPDTAQECDVILQKLLHYQVTPTTRFRKRKYRDVYAEGARRNFENAQRRHFRFAQLASTILRRNCIIAITGAGLLA